MKKVCSIILVVFLSFSILLTGCGKNENNQAGEGAENNYKENIEDNSTKTDTKRIDIWDGSVATEFGGGNGSIEKPYLIKTAAQLAYLSECCKNGQTFLGENFKLVNNINLNGLEWYPIGQHTLGNESHKVAFQGTFDGNNCFVTNFNINNDSVRSKNVELDVGLFGYVNSAYIHDLIVKNFVYQQNGHWTCVGGLIGWANGNTSVDNCHVINGFISVTAADTKVGGLIGCIEGEKEYYVANCSADASVFVQCSVYNDLTYKNEDGVECYYSKLCYLVGGLIGESYYVRVFNCSSSGEVYADMITDANDFTGDFIGGLIGYASFSPVYNSYSTATVKTFNTEDEGYIGGLIGLAGANIYSSYSAGKVECTSPDFYCGGLIGGTYDEIINCFSVAEIDVNGKDITCHKLLGVSESSKKDKEEVFQNCYISADSKYKISENAYEPTRNEVNEVRGSEFTKKSFLLNTIGLSALSQRPEDPGKVYSAWIINDNSLPTLKFENEIKQSVAKIDLEPDTYLGMTAKDVIKKIGDDYQTTSGSLTYPGTGITFVLNIHTEKRVDNREVVGIAISKPMSLGDSLNSSMNYQELTKAKPEIDAPTYMEMDGSYIVTLSVGGLNYSYTWSTENYDTEKCDYVSITKSN